MSELPHPRRVVTGHDAAGRAIYVADGAIPAVHVTDTFPSSNDIWIDPIRDKTENLANSDGVVLRVVDFKPHNITFFHRTESLDFGIVTQGEITCCLDDGAEKVLKVGDICVQRGTIHSWENRTNETCRMAFVLTAAKTVVINDKALETTGIVRDIKSEGMLTDG